MRNLLLLVVCVFFTYTTFAQETERQQKIRKVEESRTRPSTNNRPTESGNRPYTNYNYNRPNSYYGPYYRPVRPYYYSPYQWGYTPYWNTNRTWNRRSYIMTTNEDLIRSNSNRSPMRLSIGALAEVDNYLVTFSPYMVIGRQSFMIIQYHFSLPNQYPYYDNIETWEAVQWEDEYQGQEITKGEFAIGAGTTIEQFSPYIMIGVPVRRTYDTYIDETYVLSSPSMDGIYSINKQVQTNISLRGGFIYHWEVMEVIAQLRYDGKIGIGLGVGIKL